jgi:hypothetical protein
MPFICLARTDIPNSTLQITDLWPNKSQTNPVIDPPAVGPLYINAPVTNTVTLNGSFAFVSAVSGLAAYLLANVQATGAGGDALTAVEADACAAGIIARMRNGLPLALANINTVLAVASPGGGGAGTVLTGGGSLSTGAVTDVLRILAGITYTVPAGTTVQAAGVFTPQGSPAAFNAANFAEVPDILPTDDSFYKSLSYGKIAGFKDSAFVYLGTTGAAITVYDNAGGAY